MLTSPPRQRVLLEALLAAPSVSAAATDLGVSRSNVYASLRRVGRNVGVADVPELLRLLRAGSSRPDTPGLTMPARDLLARCSFPPPGTPVSLAVSGGADSLALLVLAVEAGCDVTAVHVDHGLRPGSAAEADVVAEVAARFGAGVPSRCGSTVGAGPNLEARARRARYDALPADVLTGHTADDQAETVLLNLLRGAGPRRPGRLRPGASTAAAAAPAGTRTSCAPTSGIQPVHDPSNDDPRFRRNRVRHELLPLLDAIAERDVAAVLARQADGLRADAELLERARRWPSTPPTPRPWPPRPSRSPRRAVRRWLRAGDEQHPPDAATVARVLAVARGEAVACEVGGGRAGPPQPAAPGPVAEPRYVAGVASEAEHQHLFDSPDLGEVVVDAATLQARVAELGAEITRGLRRTARRC